MLNLGLVCQAICSPTQKIGMFGTKNVLLIKSMLPRVIICEIIDPI